MNKARYKLLFTCCLIACVGVFGTYRLSIETEDELALQKDLRFKAIAEEISKRFQEDVNIGVVNLLSLQAFYHASKDVSVESFKAFSSTIIGTNKHNIQALEWIPKVNGLQREKFEASIKKSYPSFYIKERNSAGKLVKSTKKSIYYPVAFVEPYLPNQVAHGFDLNSSEKRRASLEFVRNTGAFSATAAIRLVQEKEESYGFLMFAPVYQGGQSQNKEGYRADSLLGFVLGVYRIDGLISNANKRANKEGLTLTLVDLGQKSGAPLYGVGNSESYYGFEIDLPNRRWELRVSAESILQERTRAQVIINWLAVSGVFVSLLLALFYYFFQVAADNGRKVKKLGESLKTHNQSLEQTIAVRTKALEKTNTALSEHVQELEKSNRDLDSFAYVASHDLKAPLRGIDQLATWITEDLEEGKMEEVPGNLLLLRQRAQRLGLLLNDLLAYSRITRTEKVIEEVNSRTLVEEIFQLTSPPPNFKLSIQGDMPIFSTASAPFEQVVLNLLSNAIKHHDRPDGHIQVSCHEYQAYYEFCFEDDGPGIHPDYHEQIFDLFKTLRPRDEVEGSGMGLAMIKRIVEEFKGKVRVESTGDKGCKFYFTWSKMA